MKTNWIKSLTTGLVAALIAPTCACASQLTNKSPLRGVSSLAEGSGLKIDFQNRSHYEFKAIGGGIDGSGGGSVIKCVVGGKTQYTLLDYQEAAQKNIQVDLGAKSLSVGQKIETVLGRLAKINPARAKYYAQLVNAYQDNVDMRSGVNFGKTPDVVDEIIPKGCERVQVVIQINPELPGDKRFVTNGDVWNQLDNETKAGIILHEISYYDQGMTSARKLRYFNAVMASPNLLSMTTKSYYEFINATGMIGEVGYNVSPLSTCKAQATFDEQDEVIYAINCDVREKNFNKGYWGMFFNWMTSEKPVAILAAVDLYNQRTGVRANSDHEIKIDEISFKWAKNPHHDTDEHWVHFQGVYGLTGSSSLYDSKLGVTNTLFEIEDFLAEVTISTSKASLKFNTRTAEDTLKCPDNQYLKNDLHVHKILKDRVVLAYQCMRDDEYSTRFINLAR